ncbi:MAG: GNAT family N-acetyltransferase [Stappiaceae bacterium]
MLYTIESVTSVQDKAGLEAMLEDYMTLMLQKLISAGGPELTVGDVLGDIWSDIDKYMPPTGRLVLARQPDGQLVGCGFMRQIGPDAGELKRLYVRPETRGHGLGRRLVKIRMDEARTMGWNSLLVDTFQGNTEMLALYKSLGFYEIPRYAENANDPSLDPFLVYLRYDFDA